MHPNAPVSTKMRVLLAVNWQQTVAGRLTAQGGGLAASDRRSVMSTISRFATRNFIVILHDDAPRDRSLRNSRRCNRPSSSCWPQLQASEHDKFAAHLYRSRREYRSVCQPAAKSGKQIERCVISSFQIAERIGFRGDFRHWEGLLRVGE
jgi:hypothetical protein